MKIFGQEISVLQNQLCAMLLTVYDWFCSQLLPQWMRPTQLPAPRTSKTCVQICRPGGLQQLQWTDLPQDCFATVGYNIVGLKSPFVTSRDPQQMVYAPNHVLIKTSHFSINYADVCIRWGLYESALRYVGWPIVPGFDFSGTVLWAGPESTFTVGDKVFGFTLFGAYSSHIVVPASQIRRIPYGLGPAEAAAVPAVAGTALHALNLAGGWPQQALTKNKAVLIHSAAGGVGSMLIQMCKIAGYSPIVAVVGASHKVSMCERLGADVVIDKSKLTTRATTNFSSSKSSSNSSSSSSCTNMSLLQEALEKASGGAGYIAVFDANGKDTLQQSYDLLCRCGRVVTYGFHSNLPRDAHVLSPFKWLKMILDLSQMPKFDPMSMVLQSKAVLGFNLSFFADELALIDAYMQQLEKWLADRSIEVANVTTFEMCDVAKAHQLIQSGQSVGKIVIKCPQ